MNGSVWLIGNKGMLGSEVELLLRKYGVSYVATDLDCDITDMRQITDWLGDRAISWIINCSAYTAVDQAEEEEELAFRINVTGVENIARTAERTGATVIHLSTDYVFDGEKEGAYAEEDPVNPIGVYGRTKLEGERRLTAATERFFLIRTAWLYGRNGKNFVETMLRLMSERDEIKVVNDQWGTPTHAPDLAAVIVKIVESGSEEFGIYHFTGEGRTNWYEFAREIKRQAEELGILDSKSRINPVSTEMYPTKAHRPKNSFLNKGKIQDRLGVKLVPWQTALREYLRGRAG